MLKTILRRAKAIPGIMIFFLVMCGIASAQSDGPSTKELGDSINILWMLIAGFLVFFMQAGFALVETGFTRAKNVSHTMMMNMMVFCIGAIGYWLVGFAFQFGAVNFTFPGVHGLTEWAHSPTTLGDWKGLLSTPLLQFGQHGFLGGSGFCLTGLTGSGILAFFLFQMVFMDTAATIPTGSTAERLKFSGFVLMGFWVSMFIYPLIGNWIWGGGWLQNLGRSMGIGNGAVDFAGSGVVHMVGGSIALAGAIVVGPRIGRFNKDGSANAMPGHNIPMGVLGTIILFFGWFGFNPGSSLAFVGGGRELAVLAAVNTLLAGAAGGMSSMLYMWCDGPDQETGSGSFGQRNPGRPRGNHRSLRLCIAAGFRGDRPHLRRSGLPRHFLAGKAAYRRSGRSGTGASGQWLLGSAGGRHICQRQSCQRRLEWGSIPGHRASSWRETADCRPRSRDRFHFCGGGRPVLLLLQSSECSQTPAVGPGRRIDGPGYAGDGHDRVHKRGCGDGGRPVVAAGSIAAFGSITEAN